MKVIDDIAEMRALSASLRGGLRSVGFVPTMGSLHEGHLALVGRARSKADMVVASIYVNPMQFAPGEDFGRYPRDLEGDLAKLDAAGCDVAFTPGDDLLYPEGASTFVNVDGHLSESYEGAIRPGHFRGVATVVAKLFNIVCPQVAVFGRKDAQQVAVIRRMIADLHFDVRLAVHDTVRDADGLAMSSRNVYLSARQRRQALSLSGALRIAAGALKSGASLSEAINLMPGAVSDQIALDYADIVDEWTFRPAGLIAAKRPMAIIAGNAGGTRLIDNLPLY